jgi:hydroxypyruvate isomerase
LFELSVNLEYMFREAGDDLPSRVAAAADAGFRKVEMFTTAGRDVAALSKALTAHGVELWTMVVDPRTRLIDPATHDEFMGLFHRAVHDARELGCSRLVVGSGPGVPWQKRAVQLDTVADAVRAIAEIAAEHDVEILLEAVNTRVDHPGVLFSRTEDSATVVGKVASPSVRLLYDLYHSVAEGEDPHDVLPEVSDILGHVQIADVPGRGEPGSGSIDWPVMLDLLRDSGYSGVIGVECQPTRTPTATALNYIRQLSGRNDS